MKILYHHRIASKDGQYVHVEAITNALQQRGNQVVTVAPSVSKQASFGSNGGWVTKCRDFLPKFCSELLEFLYSFYAFIKLSIAIIKHKPDVIYERYNLFLPAGIWAKKVFNLPLLLEVNSPLHQERSKYGGISLTRLARWTELYAWRNADFLCPVTHVLAKHLIEAGVSEKNIAVIPNGIDEQQFQSASQAPRNELFANKLVLGFVGFCREWHQLDNILKLIVKSKQQNLMLLIVGDGPASAELRRIATELGISDKLHITGIVDRSVMPEWLDQIDIALQAAVTPWSSPLKLIEYLAKGKAIIAPNTDNIKELLCHNKNALLYDMQSSSSILSCIEQILADAELRKRLGSAAANTIQEKKLTWQNNAERIEHLFHAMNDPFLPIEKEGC